MNRNSITRNQRIIAPDSSDEEALREYGRQLAMDSLMEQVLLDGEAKDRPAKIVPLKPRRWKPQFWIPAAAALVALAGLSLWKFGNQPSTQAALDPRWELLAATDADYRILEPNRVELRKGELRFTSIQPASLVVDTPNATSTAQGTDFLIGHHLADSQPPSPDQQNTNPDNPIKNTTNLTRLLVLAGTVILATDQGSLAAGPNEAVVAQAGDAPQKILVDANSSFAFDLYAQLAKENEGKNLFFSPYSMSNALLMAAEGARGKTAREMGTVLGFPESLRRKGDDSQMIPWEMGKIRVGQSELNRLMNKGDAITQEQAALRAEEATLAAKLAEMEKKLEELNKERRQQGKYDGPIDLDYEKDDVARKLEAVRIRIDTSKLRVANAIWGEQTFPFNEDWKATVTGSYGAGAVQLADFVANADSERLRINKWAEEQTEGLIKDPFPEGSLNTMTRLAIVNAIYFKGDWKKPFKKSSTSPQPFTLGSGETTQTAMMNKLDESDVKYAAFHGDGRLFATPRMVEESELEGDGRTLYPGKDGFSMIEMPYRGDKLSMVVIAPNDPAGLPSIEARLNAATLAAWMKSMKQREINVFMPKFKMETSYGKLGDADGTLAAMGMPSAMKMPTTPGSGADFSGMSSKSQLFIGSVVHKAFISVNEEGTEAAAITGYPAPGASIRAKVPFTPTFRADRPFIYLIRDRESGTVLFLGRMLNPSDLAD
jgi:serine protease inhibitor